MTCTNFQRANEDDTASKVLVFSKTKGYKHSSIPFGIAAIQKLGRAGFTKIALSRGFQFAIREEHEVPLVQIPIAMGFNPW